MIQEVHNNISLSLCCGKVPALIHGGCGDYPNSIRYECPICSRTTIPVYSTMGDTLQRAGEIWNKIMKNNTDIIIDNFNLLTSYCKAWARGRHCGSYGGNVNYKINNK
jgi:hypothetical protein